jgi:DNA-binding FrmR family transcriptional regulator
MIENDTYCPNVLDQIASAQAALSGVSKKLLECHLHSCVLEQTQHGNLDIMEELMTTLNRLIK